jgi:glycogen debranching enzyme
MGYPDAGLEIWTYPLQVLSGLHVRFHEAGRVGPLDGRALLTRVEYRPNEIVRIYSGPDFVVRERLFVPRHEPGAIITYEVEGRPDVRIEARFQPSLDLMWPGALGGQSIGWDDTLKAYVEREPLHGFSAVIRSPDTVEHDGVANRTTGRDDGVGLLLQPRGPAGGMRRASLYVAGDPTGSGDPAKLEAALESHDAELHAEAAQHDQALLAGAVQITTPDPLLNRALSWSVLALDQAWACQPAIGCGEVAGYGPSRPGRRPQYAWFFAGDGLVATEALLTAGEYERARDELAFIARYQNKTNGMIWHEMSMSAPLIDWETRYPYMFVHVDITYQYLSTLADYVAVTGDVKYLSDNWAGVEAAWRYARSLADPADGLPRIPAGKEGQNEQDKLRDDVQLSSAWIDAADAFARLANAVGRRDLAAEAEQGAQAARQSLARQSWDAARGFWLAGHTLSGRPIYDEGPNGSRIALQQVFSPAEVDTALDRLSQSAFQTDWGVRSLSAEAPTYDPNAYSRGSVWGLGTSGFATTLWKAHRPLTAWGAWRGLIGWSSLDSEGHMPEVLAGDLYHPEMESVPEQTWSSAGFLTSAVSGLLGLEVRTGEGRLVFAPHLPGDWDAVRVRNVRVGDARVGLSLHRDQSATTLEIDNRGKPVVVDFDPEIPLGARLTSAEVQGAAVPVAQEANAQDLHARLSFKAASGITRAIIRYEGGVRLAPIQPAAKAGDPSRNLKIQSASWSGRTLTIRAYVADSGHAAVDLITPMTPRVINGGRITFVASGRYRLFLQPPAAGGQASWRPVEAVVTLDPASPEASRSRGPLATMPGS